MDMMSLLRSGKGVIILVRFITFFKKRRLLINFRLFQPKSAAYMTLEFSKGQGKCPLTVTKALNSHTLHGSFMLQKDSPYTNSLSQQ